MQLAFLAAMQLLPSRQRAVLPLHDVVASLSLKLLETMCVLDVGCGAGDVAFLAAELVGSGGSVVGIDSSASALDTARLRADRLRLSNIAFIEADVRTYDTHKWWTLWLAGQCSCICAIPPRYSIVCSDLSGRAASWLFARSSSESPG